MIQRNNCHIISLTIFLFFLLDFLMYGRIELRELIFFLSDCQKVVNLNTDYDCRAELTYHVTQPYQSHVLGDLKAVGLHQNIYKLEGGQ